MQRIVFLNSHPIQYFAPLYQQMAKDTAIDLKVLYCSDETLKGATDKQFGVQVQWDIPLLEGYTSVFLKNASWKSSINHGFWGLLNWGVVGFLRKQPKSLVVVHGWAYATHVLTILAAKILGHTVCLRAETPLNQELQKNKWITLLKHLYLRGLFLFVDRGLYIGKQNKLFYQHMGFKEQQLVFTPYCVDNQRFSAIAATIHSSAAREKLQLPAAQKIVLFSGKYIDKKNPLDLLQAIALLNQQNIYAVFVGEGVLRKEMETFIQTHQLEQQVLLTGFINQSLIPYYYAAADVFVMCSGIGETWGLSVNEAMNFGLPVVISDTCGSAYDLIDGNGYVFETGNVAALAAKIQHVLTASKTDYANMQNKSKAIIGRYSYHVLIGGLKQIAGK